MGSTPKLGIKFSFQNEIFVPICVSVSSTFNLFSLPFFSRFFFSFSLVCLFVRVGSVCHISRLLLLLLLPPNTALLSSQSPKLTMSFLSVFFCFSVASDTMRYVTWEPIHATSLLLKSPKHPGPICIPTIVDRGTLARLERLVRSLESFHRGYLFL